MRVKETFEVENCENCPCYHAQYDLDGQEINGCCEWQDVEDVSPREGVPSWCWLREGALVVKMKKLTVDKIEKAYD